MQRFEQPCVRVCERHTACIRSLWLNEGQRGYWGLEKSRTRNVENIKRSTSCIGGICAYLVGRTWTCPGCALHLDVEERLMLSAEKTGRVSIVSTLLKAAAEQNAFVSNAGGGQRAGLWGRGWGGGPSWQTAVNEHHCLAGSERRNQEIPLRPNHTSLHLSSDASFWPPEKRTHWTEVHVGAHSDHKKGFFETRRLTSRALLRSFPSSPSLLRLTLMDEGHYWTDQRLASSQNERDQKEARRAQRQFRTLQQDGRYERPGHLWKQTEIQSGISSEVTVDDGVHEDPNHSTNVTPVGAHFHNNPNDQGFVWHIFTK